MTVLNILGIYATVKDLATDLKDTVRVSKSSEKILWAVDYCFVMLIASVGAYNGFSRVTELLQCLSSVQKIKKEIITDQDKEFKCCEKKNCSILVSFLVFATTTVILNYRRIFIKAIETRKDIIVTSLYSCYEAAYVMLFVLEMQFLFSSLEIYEALKTLNNALERASQQKTVMDRTRLLVSQIILHNTDALMAEELDKFYRYLLLNKTSYAPMALCTLSRSLLATMLGSVATYLVIIVQLSAVEGL
ncbi:uncharacterized protein LOC135082485 [Ostrinia nubilalis]|uniref:uncharacterized protein LOC135082485 n=1 Tax=Ostrinia nubilalis TaxID=29057 RepID=UPI00308248D8